MKIIGNSEAGIAKMLLFPQKLQKLLSEDVDLSYPISVELSLTSRCNQNCIWCGDIKLRKKTASDLSYEKASDLFADLYKGGTRGVVIEGGGEPLLHPQFTEIVEAASQNGLSLGLITNGTISLSIELIQKFQWIRISLDAANSLQYQAIKAADKFNSVMHHLQYIGQHKKQTVLGVGYVVSNKNSEDDEQLIKLIEQLKYYDVDYIHFRPVVDYPNLVTQKDISYLFQFSSDEFRIDIEALTSNLTEGNGCIACVAHSLSSVINSDGNVYLCGRLNIHPWISPIGNINEANFEDIWTGAERLKQAQQVSNSEFCRQYCPNCRMSKYNLLLHSLQRIKTKDFI